MVKNQTSNAPKAEKWIKPYGDTLNDGIVQMSLTLPIKNDARAKKAAEQYVGLLNLQNVKVVHAEEMAEGFTHFVIYAKATPALDYESVRVTEMAYRPLSFYAVNQKIETQIKRKLVVVGATIGSDAHTVGIDAIMNMKGYNQDYGLERYPQIEAINLGAQVPFEVLVEKARKVKADAVLVSQTVTQKEAHIHNFTELIEFLEAENIRQQFILIAGGPRISHDFALELGYDAGFGPGTVPSQVASFLVHKFIQKMGDTVK